MNLCKSGISARTKSLREKFSRNRSYSELSFKDSSASSTPTGEAPPFRSSGRKYSRNPLLPEQVSKEDHQFCYQNVNNYNDLTSENVRITVKFDKL